MSSRHTLRAYGGDLAELAEWATRSGKEPGSLAYRDLRSYAAALSERGLARASVSRKLAAVRSFHDHLARTGAAHAEPGRAAADAEEGVAPATGARARRDRPAPRPDPGLRAAGGA